MKALKLWVTVVLILALSMIITAPREAKAGKSLGLTKKQFIVSCNNLLSKFDLRFIVDDETKIINGAAYKLSSGSATLFVEGSNTLSKVALITMNVQGRPDREFLDVMGSVVISVLSQSVADFNKFLSQWKDNTAQGLKEFTIQVKDKVFEVQINQAGVVGLTIKPAQ